MGSLLLGYNSDLSYLFILFIRCVLDLLPFIRLKATHCPGQHLFWGHSSAFYYIGSPSLCWSLASSGSSGTRPGLADLALLRSYDPSHFRVGNIHGKSYAWQNLISNSSCGEVDLLEIIREGVRVEHFFRPFRGNFKRKAYDSDIFPPVIINNSAICSKFYQFISDTIIQWVTAGVKAVWGPVDQVASPYLILPLTVEPTKPRLCRDERYLNLWIRDLPFNLDHLCDLPKYVLPHHFQTTFDDKNGYQHVLLHSSSQAYFGFRWQGFYFVFRTLPFGWKASAFNHKLGLAVSGAARSIGVPVPQYPDDRHVGQLFTTPLRMTRGPSFQ